MAWAFAPRQELADALAEEQIRDLEAKAVREDRREDAEIAFLAAQTRKVAGEVTQQPLEEEERRARIKEIEARTGEIKARTVRIWLMNLLPPLAVAVGIIVGSADSGSLAGNGYELLEHILLQQGENDQQLD